MSKFDGATWTTYVIADQLVDNQVNAIVIDNAGNKWFGTAGGVNKFGGDTWATYTTANSGLVSNYINAIVIDSTGNKWFGTSGGVSKFDGATWATYTTANSGLVNNAVYSIAIDSAGNKWFGTRGGVSKFDGATWTTYTTANSGLVDGTARSIAIDSAGNKWFGISAGWLAGGVSKFDGATWTTYTTANSGLVNNDVQAIAIDSAGNKWFGTSRYIVELAPPYPGGVSRFDGTTWSTYLNTYIHTIVIDSAGNKWFGTRSDVDRWGGVSKFDDVTWTTYNTTNSGLVDDDVLTIAIDSAGNKWFGTNGGVSKFDDTPTAPVANAGGNQLVITNTIVTLNGSASFDPDGDALTYGWKQTGGEIVTFMPNLNRTTFTAPASAGVLTFTLTVTDIGGLTDTDTTVISAYNEIERAYAPLILRNRGGFSLLCEEILAKEKIWQGTFAWSCDPEVKKEGNSSIKLNADTLSDVELYSPLISVIPNQSYRVSYWVKTNLTVDTATVYGRVVVAQYTDQVQESDAVNQNRIDSGFSLGENVGGETDWIQKSYGFTTTANTHYVRLRGLMGNGLAKGQIWFDGITIE